MLPSTSPKQRHTVSRRGLASHDVIYLYSFARLNTSVLIIALYSVSFRTPHSNMGAYLAPKALGSSRQNASLLIVWNTTQQHEFNSIS